MNARNTKKFTTPTVIEIESVSNYLRRIESLKKKEIRAGNNADFLFRGQDCDDPLLPRFARLRVKGDSKEIEKLLLAEFKRTAIPFIRTEPRTTWDWLALAQHHGLPTRLLDWSLSALAALWFAIQSPVDPEKPKKRVVWVFRAHTDDFLPSPAKGDPLKGNRTRIFRPRVIAERINAQLGLFTCHMRQDNDKFVALEKNKYYKNKLTRFEISKENLCAQLKEELFSCGVNSATLFPELDGVASLLETRYFWPEKKEEATVRTMQRGIKGKLRSTKG